MSDSFRKLFIHLLVVLGFAIAALAYFNPVLSGKKLYQNDIVQYRGNARQLIEHREETGNEIYWTDSVFGGMPTYQLGARYPFDFMDTVDRIIRFLPRPADYLFLYFLCFYILLMVMGVDWKVGALGALAFGFSTYLVIILGAGHNAKAHAIAYFPLVLAGVHLLFRRRLLAGFLLTTLALALELQAGHPQMTYYLFMALGIYILLELLSSFTDWRGLQSDFARSAGTSQNKSRPSHFTALGLFIVATILALGTNAGNLLATSEYSKQSTRGASELTITPSGDEIEPQSGLSFDYITEYSYGFAESLNLFIPRAAGGGSGSRPDADSQTVQYLQNLGLPQSDAIEFAQNVPLYWGKQPIVEAPAYLGAGIFLLAVIALFYLRGRLKLWAMLAMLLALLLSYGKNLEFLTSLFIDYFPFYSKFRAVTSIQVIIEMIVPLMGAVGLYKLFADDRPVKEKWKAVLYGSALVGGVALLLLLFSGAFFDFASPYDRQFLQYEDLGISFVDAVREDRQSLLVADCIRVLAITGLVTALLWASLRNKLSRDFAIVGIGIVILVDLISFDLNFVNEEDFVSPLAYDMPFQQYEADQSILKDTTTHYRVYDLLGNPFNTGRTSFFHKALGGYHGAKPGRIQDIYDFYLTSPEGYPAEVGEDNIEILSMYNVRYFIIPREGRPVAQKNPYAMGPAWFVDSLRVVNSANDEISALKDLNGNTIAIVNENQLSRKAKEKAPTIGADSTAYIQLTKYSPTDLTFKSENRSGGFAVFSENWYPEGWKATIDGEEVPIERANYSLRGLYVPPGKHRIEFTFDPPVIEKGSYLMLGSNLIIVILLLGGGYMIYRKRG